MEYNLIDSRNLLWWFDSLLITHFRQNVSIHWSEITVTHFLGGLVAYFFDDAFEKKIMMFSTIFLMTFKVIFFDDFFDDSFGLFGLGYLASVRINFDDVFDNLFDDFNDNFFDDFQEYFLLMTFLTILWGFLDLDTFQSFNSASFRIKVPLILFVKALIFLKCFFCRYILCFLNLTRWYVCSLKLPSPIG